MAKLSPILHLIPLAHDSDDIKYDNTISGLTATDVKAAIDELEAAIGGASYTDEQARDAIAAFIQNGTGISWVHDDGANTLTPTVSLAAFSTTNLAEGSNLYFTDERVDDRINALFVEGEGIDFVYSDVGNTFTVSGEDASTTNKGIASFSSADFSVSSGAVSILDSGIDHGSLSGLADDDHNDATNGYVLREPNASVVDNTLVRWDSTTGRLIQESSVVLSDAEAMSGLTQLDCDNLRLDGNTLSATTGGLNFQVVTSSSFTFQSSAADNDLTFAFTGTTNSGEFKWMEDEDYFQFNDEIRSFRSDTATDSQFTLEQGSTGDATQSWLLTGGQQYRAYIDNSDNDSFKIEDTTGVDVFQEYNPSTGTLHMGVLGDTSFGDSTDRFVYSEVDGKTSLGTTSKGWANIRYTGLTAVVAGSNRHTTSNTAGNTLTVNAGGATSGATDKAGGNLILSPGISTGTARDQINLKGYTWATASGTSDNTQVDRHIVGCTKTLTDNTGIALVNCTIANNTVIAGIIRYAVEVFDGTDVQVEEGCVSYHVTNKAGALANNATTKFGNQQAATAGTLTVTFTITAANPAVLTVNANSSLTPSTGYPRITYNLDQLTQQAVAIQ